jgi:hypothetical protein
MHQAPDTNACYLVHLPKPLEVAGTADTFALLQLGREGIFAPHPHDPQGDARNKAAAATRVGLLMSAMTQTLQKSKASYQSMGCLMPVHM